LEEKKVSNYFQLAEKKCLTISSEQKKCLTIF
jgi:hypothetical protein